MTTSWTNLRGDPICLKWAIRDLKNLEAALTYTPGRHTVVQAGGNLGVFPKRLAQVFETVHTFEPDAELFRLMKANAREPNIVMHKAALGCVRDTVSVACKRRDSSGRAVHAGLTHIAGPGNIPQMLIDDLELVVCDLIYLDIEGYELNALIGAAITILRCRPVIVVEINRNIEHYGSSANAVRDFMLCRGYSRALSMNSDEVFVPCR